MSCLEDFYDFYDFYAFYDFYDLTNRLINYVTLMNGDC